MSASQRNKGARGELEVVELLHAHGWDRAHRNFGSGSAGHGDIAYGPQRFSIECKRTNRLRIHEALDQAADGCAPHQAPLVVYRRDNGPWLAILEADELLPLIRLAETS